MAQQLYGPPNPKTLVPPIIAPPMADFDAWRASTAAPNTNINTENPLFYSDRSGYNVQQRTTLDTQPQKFTLTSELATFPTISTINTTNMVALAGPTSWTLTMPAAVNSNSGIDTALQSGFTSKFGSAGGDYQLFMETREPVPSQATPDNKFVQDARLRATLMKDPAGLRDPRAYSFGPTDRIRINPDTGVPTYDYKDIDESRQPSLITRTNLNFSLDGATNTNDIKTVAHDQFIRDTNAQRLDLQQSMMRKRNSELWQRKVAPISPGYFY